MPATMALAIYSVRVNIGGLSLSISGCEYTGSNEEREVKYYVGKCIFRVPRSNGTRL
jgi:hypothetical protein